MARMISLGLAGAFCWGLAPIFGKLGLRDVHPMDGLAARTTVDVGLSVDVGNHNSRLGPDCIHLIYGLV